MPPLLDSAALQAKPLTPAVMLPGLEHPAFRDVLAAAMPGVRHSLTTSWTDEQDEHSLVDPETGSAVRIIITRDRRQGRAQTCIAEVGTRDPWDELVGYLGEWERNGRTLPERWKVDAHTIDADFVSAPCTTSTRRDDERSNTTGGGWWETPSAVRDSSEHKDHGSSSRPDPTSGADCRRLLGALNCCTGS